VGKSDPIKTLLFVSYDPRKKKEKKKATFVRTFYQVGSHNLYISVIPILVLKPYSSLEPERMRFGPTPVLWLPTVRQPLMTS